MNTTSPPGLDRRRLSALKENILDLTRHHRLDKDAGFTGDDEADLQKLDAYLCDLKEAQIRDGLHILGAARQDNRRQICWWPSPACRAAVAMRVTSR